MTLIVATLPFSFLHMIQEVSLGTGSNICRMLPLQEQREIKLEKETKMCSYDTPLLFHAIRHDYIFSFL